MEDSPEDPFPFGFPAETRKTPRRRKWPRPVFFSALAAVVLLSVITVVADGRLMLLRP